MVSQGKLKSYDTVRVDFLSDYLPFSSALCRLTCLPKKRDRQTEKKQTRPILSNVEQRAAWTLVVRLVELQALS